MLSFKSAAAVWMLGCRVACISFSGGLQSTMSMFKFSLYWLGEAGSWGLSDLESWSNAEWGGDRFPLMWVTCCYPPRIQAAIHQSGQQKLAGQHAACYLTWLYGCSSAHRFTQSHGLVMIYCLAVYGNTLEHLEQTAERCLMCGTFGWTRSQKKFLCSCYLWRGNKLNVWHNFIHFYLFHCSQI